jgi:chromosome segregation ATPase
MNEELTGLRDEMRQGFAEMRQGFARVDERLERVDERLEQLTQDVTQLHRDVATLGLRVDALERRVRDNGILLEALRDDVRLIAEGHVLLNQRVDNYRSEADTQRAIIALLQTSYRDLDRRLTRLEERAGDPGPGARSR